MPELNITVDETLAVISAGTVGLQGPTGATGATGPTGPQGASYAQGDPIYVTVRNQTGSSIPKGSIVYTSGSNGTNVQVSLAQANSDATSARSLGFTASAIAHGADGLVMVEGYLEGLNTAGLTSGQILYLSGTTPGAWTTTKPTAPTHLVYVGVVTRVNANNGSVYVKVQNGYELDEIHDVSITQRADGFLMYYDAASDLYNFTPNFLGPMMSGAYYRPLVGAATGVASGTGTLCVYPLIVPTTTTFNQIAATPTTVTTSGTVRLGIYANSAGAPGALIADYGTASFTTSNVPATITISQTLAPGKYWLAGVVQTGSATWLGTSATASGYASPTQRMSSVTSSAFATGWTQASVTGALPSTGASMTVSNIGLLPYVKVA